MESLAVGVHFAQMLAGEEPNGIRMESQSRLGSYLRTIPDRFSLPTKEMGIIIFSNVALLEAVSTTYLVSGKIEGGLVAKALEGVYVALFAANAVRNKRSSESSTST